MPTTTAKKIGVGLIRVSTGAQAEEDRASIPAQRALIEQIASRYGIEVSRVFELADISGAEVAFSPRYHAFLETLKDPNVNAVITREFSRLMRPERFDDFGILQHFVDHGITLYFPNDVLDLSSRQARFMAGIRAGVSGLERGDIAERVMSAKEIKRKRGEHPVGEHTLIRGLGYSKALGWYWKEKELEPVRLLFKLFLDGCHVYERLCDLTGLSRTTLTSILKSPVYTGWMVYDHRLDQSATGYIPPRPGRKGYRRKIARAPEEVIRIHLPMEPLITEAEHQSILEIVDNKRRHYSSARDAHSPRFTYRSFLYCGNCHAPMYVWTKAAGADFYHCRTNLTRYRKRYPGATCSNKNMSRHLLEPKLDAALVAHLTNREFLSRIFGAHFAKLAEHRLPDADVLLQQRFEALTAKRKRIIHAFIDGNLSTLEKNEMLRDCDEAIEVLNQTVPTPAERPPFGKEQVIEIVEMFDDWPSLNQEPRRELLTRLCPEIYVHRYVVSGVSLRVSGNFAVHSGTASEVMTSDSLPPATRSDLIYVPFPESLLTKG